MAGLTLHQFLFSHFNEKARWALDYKGIPHQRRAYLPGPHRPAMQKLSGQGQTPVLSVGDEVIAGSAEIIDSLESRYPEPALYPSDTALRTEALALQTHFDAVVGPAVRTALFSVLINEGGYITRMFARDAGGLTRALYRATFPLARGMIAKGNGVTDPANVERAFEITESTLQEVSDQAAPTGYLVGNSFSVADLTAAALLAPLAALSHPDMARPQPVPQTLEAFYARWADDPAIAWVRHQYEEHRPA
jgi:glutathione S-transferase